MTGGLGLGRIEVEISSTGFRTILSQPAVVLGSGPESSAVLIRGRASLAVDVAFLDLREFALGNISRAINEDAKEPCSARVCFAWITHLLNNSMEIPETHLRISQRKTRLEKVKFQRKVPRFACQNLRQSRVILLILLLGAGR